LYELGVLDTFLGIATLVQETKSQGGHSYNFVKFLSREETKRPYIRVTEMWHPFLEPNVAIANSVEMGGEQGGMRHMILTGPNAGGKSTFLTGMVDAILLSQVFGIAPAKEAILTPFDKINTYIEIADDIASGRSRFMAEAHRMQEHLHLLKILTKQDAFSFSIFDEPFNGTNPTEGAAAEYSTLDYIAQHTNTLNIVATHYPIVMLLENKSLNKGFKNYKVVINHEGEKIKCSYKIFPGKSNQTIAIDILKAENFSTKIIEQAREIIIHPQKYKQ